MFCALAGKDVDVDATAWGWVSRRGGGPAAFQDETAQSQSALADGQAAIKSAQRAAALPPAAFQPPTERVPEHATVPATEHTLEHGL